MLRLKMRILLFCIIVMLISSCGQSPQEEYIDILHLNCSEAKNVNIPKLSDILSDISYIALETKDICLIDQVNDLILTDNYIVLDGGYENECYVFDKKSGKHLHTIGMWNDPGPTGYSDKTFPLYVINNKVYLKANNEGTKYKVYSLDNGCLLKSISGGIGDKKWPNDYLYPLNDSIMLQYDNNYVGNNKYGLQICTWSGNILKRFLSTNNFKRNKALDYFISYYNEIIFYRYKDQIHYHEFTSDTIFRLNEQLEREPVYVVDKGDRMPIPEMRNQKEMEDLKKRLIKFDNIIENDSYLLMIGRYWNKETYIYNKQTGETSLLNGEQINGFKNDLNGFLPFLPIERGRNKAENEVWAILQPDEYMEGVEATGVNPLGIKLKFDDNPIIVIGTLK